MFFIYSLLIIFGMMLLRLVLSIWVYVFLMG